MTWQGFVIRACTVCGCQFLTDHDLALHRTVCPKKPEWKRSPYDEGVWLLPVQDDPRLASLVRSEGFVVTGAGTVTLNQKGTLLKRRQT